MQPGRKELPRILFILVSVLLLAAAPSLASADRTAKKGKATNRAAKVVAADLMRAQPALQPASTLPRFAQIAPATDAQTVTATTAADSPAVTRVQFDTGLCMAFLGAAQETGPAPDRDSVHGNPTVPEQPILCQVAAGVSYNLAPGANLNLGYQLPNRVWGGVGRNLGLDDTGLDMSAQGLSVGVKVTF